jgi:hypothetical protein
MVVLDGYQTYHAYLQEWQPCALLRMLPQGKVTPLENLQIACAGVLQQAAVMIWHICVPPHCYSLLLQP